MRSPLKSFTSLAISRENSRGRVLPVKAFTMILLQIY